MRQIVGILAAALVVAAWAAPASAENLSLRAPAWAQALVATDIIPTTGGRAELAANELEVSARISIAPTRGGVARVVRYDARADRGAIFLRRLTGHATTGWWLWGSDAPHVLDVPNAQRRELAGLISAAMRAANTPPGEACAGEQAYIELYSGGRSQAITRACVSSADAPGRLALRLSELAGSRNEEELAAAAVAEVMAVDRAFAAMAQAEGVPAAFEEYAAEDALIVTGAAVLSGRSAIVAGYADWPPAARLEWSPQTARVSARGDMAWTWGNSVYTAPDGARREGRYVSVWTRDYQGRWRYAFDAPIR